MDASHWIRQNCSRLDNEDARFEAWHDAENVELQPTASRWGYAMYRGTWDDDAKWTKFLKVYDAMALFSPLDWRNRKCGPVKTGLLHMDAIFDDRTQFENASMTQIRSHFRGWSDTDFGEPGIDLAPDARLARNRSMWEMERYRRFIYVDEHVLESVLANADTFEEHDYNYGGWVNLVDQNQARPGGGRPIPDDEVGRRNWTDPSTIRVNMPSLYNAWYIKVSGPFSWPDQEPPFIWLDELPFWPAREIFAEDAYGENTEVGQELDRFYIHPGCGDEDLWLENGGLEGYIECMRGLGRSIYRYDGPRRVGSASEEDPNI